MKRILCLVCCLLLSLTCAAAAEETPRIAAANYALTFAVEQICGHDWSIETVNPEGKADFMPDDAQLEALRACDLVVVFGTEAWVSKLDEARVLKVGDALTGVNPDAGEGFWLAPINMALVGYTVSDALAALDPGCAKEIANHNELFVQAMIDLDNTLRVIEWVADAFLRGAVLFSLMSQYVPMGAQQPPLDRTLTREEYDGALSWMELCGVTNGFTQEFASATTELLPEFNFDGIY